MLRHVWRKWLKIWRKIPCFNECNGFVSFSALPNTAVDFQLKVSEDLLFEYNLDMFGRWRLYPVLIVNGFPFRGLCYNVGMASGEWLDEHFGHDDSDFESYA